MSRTRAPRGRRGSSGWSARGLVVLAAALAGATAARGAPAPPPDVAVSVHGPAAAARPRVALVLAGGGARGAAHVGVLKVLEELNVPVDCIAGTSMGALVGGGYAAGLPAHEVEQLVRGIDWKSVIGGVGGRSLEPAEQKRLNAASGSIELGYRDGRLVTSTGVVATARIEDVLRTYVARARATPDFDQLPIPFRAVAIDYLSGDLVVLGDGDLATAMRASMAIPGVFAPVDTRGRLLGDGGGLRNLPIDVGRELCGDVVIAVNLVKPPVTRAQLGGPLQLLRRNMDVMAQTSERQQLQSLGESDVRIDVDLGDMAVQDFGRATAAIDVGERAARAMAPALARLSVPPKDYRAWRERVTQRQDIEVQLADVRFEGVERVNPAFLQTVARIAPGDVVDADALASAAQRMSALDEIDAVGYELRGDPERPTLVWQPAERSVGHEIFRPSLGLYGAREGDQRFELAIQHVRRWVNPLGAQWRNDLVLGSTTLLRTRFYQPLDVAQRFFVEPMAMGRISLEDVYLDGDRIARFRFIDVGGGLDLGANVGTRGQLRAGYWLDRRRIEWDIGLRLLPNTTFTDAGWRAEATWDGRDAPTFASAGLAAALQVVTSEDGLGADRDWQRLEAAVRRAFTVGDAVVTATGAGGWRLGDTLPGDRMFSLGGPQSFPGLAPGELRVARYWTLAGDVRWPLTELVSLANESLYVGLGAQATGAHERLDGLADETLYGGSLYLGGRTPIGTLTLGAGAATDSWTVWLTLGKAIGSGSILNEPLFR